ncbi:hypothetical protein E2C01_091990 [Portunus trituberculatus]|uniref:Uncharacterized protein n=1 Tax=Portunus trituberculatus TaxID=210409 RepID=A0A5B7JQ62_PORTR|nr:hypothetical protein [Portunus trituberculatus]
MQVAWQDRVSTVLRAITAIMTQALPAALENMSLERRELDPGSGAVKGKLERDGTQPARREFQIN